MKKKHQKNPDTYRSYYSLHSAIVVAVCSYINRRRRRNAYLCYYGTGRISFSGNKKRRTEFRPGAIS